MDLPVAAIVHQAVQAVDRDQVIRRQVVSDTQISQMHIGAGGRIIVHDGRPGLIRRRLAERTFTKFTTIIILSDNMKLTRMQIQDRTGIITFLESGSQRQDQRRISSRISRGRQVQDSRIPIRNQFDRRGRRHRNPVEEQRRKLDQHIPAILFHQPVRHSVDQQAGIAGTTESDPSLDIRNNGRQLAEYVGRRPGQTTQVAVHLQAFHIPTGQAAKTFSLDFNTLQQDGFIYGCL